MVPGSRGQVLPMQYSQIACISWLSVTDITQKKVFSSFSDCLITVTIL